MISDRHRLKPTRGQRLRLKPHPESCELADLRAYANRTGGPFAVDLFCCGGGLSLGLEEAGFKVLLGVDHDEIATETHRAHFGGASLHADLSKPEVISSIANALQGIDISLVAGSPPCQPFSRAGDSKLRSLVQAGNRPPEDDRRELWRSFLGVVKQIRPPTVLMENVPDLVGGRNSHTFRQIIDTLEGLGYKVYSRILPCWEFGVPQHRQRLFIVGVKGTLPFIWPKRRFAQPPGVWEAISDLSPVEPGVSNDGLPYFRQDDTPLTAIQRWARRGQPRGRGGKVYDHYSRAVRSDDLEAFGQMTPHMRYSELPSRLRRYRSDQFDDKYNRLHQDEPSRTITAHIARDGYWYIHPTQHRTLTVREAARIQTFPDRIRFAGTPSQAFRQIGEAVPPLVGLAIGKTLIRSLKGQGRRSHTVRSSQVSSKLVQWIALQPESELRVPWRLGNGLWQVLMGMALFQNLPSSMAYQKWTTFRDRWQDVVAYLSDENRPAVLGPVGPLLSEQLNSLAIEIVQRDTRSQTSLREVLDVSANRMEIALSLAGESQNFRLTTALRRLLGRLFGDSLSESRFGHQNALARLVGVVDEKRAYAAVLEVSERHCHAKEPSCNLCPISEICLWYRMNRKTHNPSPKADARLWHS